MRTKTLSVMVEKKQTFPFVEKFGSYGDIYMHKIYLKNLYKIDIFCAYLGLDGHFWGLFWLENEQPTKTEIQKMKDLANCKIDNGIPSNIVNDEGFVRRILK